jgi:hypothetical protein
MATSKKAERRRSRASFTTVLRRLCERLDRASIHEVSYRFLGQEHRSRVSIDRLWVVGSYARGAPDCGDLDVVVHATCNKGGLPFMSAISRAAFGRAPDVRFYSGTPEENSSGVAFPEAIQVWEPGCSWSESLDSIPVDPDAARFDREVDAVPLRIEQTACSTETFEELLSLRDRRIVDWSFVPAEEVPSAPESLEDHEARFARRLETSRGKKTQKLLPLLLGYFRAHDPQGEWARGWIEQTCFRHGSTRVLVGRPRIDVSLLDACACAEIAVVPHLSRRGPDGIWLVTRGPKHPFVQELESCRAYYLEESGHPSYFVEVTSYSIANGIDLFTTPSAAHEAAQEMSEGDDIDGLRVAHASGRMLERLIGRVDVVDVDSTHRFALSPEGSLITGGSTLAVPSQLLAALRSRASHPSDTSGR